ncbi:MAG: hypothetical protein K0Q63_105 [Paenibacillus sp.]|nr:hypothetical protein [Paenibacillus sp.]
MSYETEHASWIRYHQTRRKGERLDALKRGHGYGNQLFAEKIWWNLLGHFNGLHPEYEVRDWRGRAYYVDFMLVIGMIRIVFEVMDYGSHGTDRTKYRQDLNRGLFLQSQDCLVYYISLDELKENPSFIQSVVRNILSPFTAAVGGGTSASATERTYNRTERALMRVAIRNNRLIQPTKAARELDLSPLTVMKYCRLLVDKGKFRAIPRGTSKRINFYEYIGTLQSSDLV